MIFLMDSSEPFLLTLLSALFFPALEALEALDDPTNSHLEVAPDKELARHGGDWCCTSNVWMVRQLL